MLVPAQEEEMGEADEALNEENVPIQSNDPPLSRVNTLESREDRLKLNKLMEVCTKLKQRVIDLENTKTIQTQEISSLKKRVKRLEKKRRSRTHGLKRLYKVGLSIRVESSAEEQSLGKEDASKQGRNIADIDANAEITLVDETAEDQGRFDDQDMFDTSVLDDEEEVFIKEAQDVQKVIKDIIIAVIEETISTAAPITTVDVTTDELIIAQALVEIKKYPQGLVEEKAQQFKDENLAWDNVQAMIDANYELATRLQEEEQEELTIEEKSKKQKVEDDKEYEELKRLEIILDDGDDVTIDATPLSIKTLIINYKIYKERKKSYFQLFKADGNSQMYLTFNKMLKNVDREDLEVLWRLVKDRFIKSMPVDDMDSYLLDTLKAMFEHHVEDTVWKSQQGLTKVKSWKLFDSCRVHCVIMQNILYYLLVEKMNDLDSISLDDLYNHLKVYEAEVQKKPNSNSQDMAFISSSKNSNNEDGNTVCVTTASTAFPTGSVNVATISQDTASAFIASQSNGSQIKFEDINQIDEDDMEEMDIKWNMALLSMRADKFWKRTRKKISIQGSDVAGYNAVPHPTADLYLSPKKDLSWTGLPEFVDDTDVASPNPPKPVVKFVKPKDSQPESKSKEQETPKKSQVKYAKQYRHSNKRPKGNQRRRVQRETNRSMRPSFRPAGHRPHGPSMNLRRPTMKEDQNKDTSTSEDVASLNPRKPFVKFVKPKESQPESKSKEQETPKKSQ
nr:hypothetical protein [Tanacetum cinerariifolium]